jgi:predicted kinase
LIYCAAGARIVRADVVRKRMMGLLLSGRLLSHGYTGEINQRTYDLFYKELEIAIEQGYQVIADSFCALPEQGAGVEALADKLNVNFCGLWVTAPAYERIRQPKKMYQILQKPKFNVRFLMILATLAGTISIVLAQKQRLWPTGVNP